jgi:hypothetical protein
MRLTKYGQEAFDGIAFDELLAEQKRELCYWARVENSGSEGIYLEVACWNDRTHCWQRYAFLKFENNKDRQPHHLAKEINAHCGSHMSVIHVMPNYVPKPQESPCLTSSSAST